MVNRGNGGSPWERLFLYVKIMMALICVGLRSGRRVVRDWVLRFNTEGPDGLLDRKAPALDGEQRLALANVVEQVRIPAIHGVVRWRLVDLAQWLWDEYCISVDQSTVSRELKALGYVKMTARPRHEAQNEYAVDDFKKTSPPEWRKSGLNSPPTPQ